jgi:hypothetical protein
MMMWGTQKAQKKNHKKRKPVPEPNAIALTLTALRIPSVFGQTDDKSVRIWREHDKTV